MNGSPCWTCGGALTAESWTSGSVRTGSGTVRTSALPAHRRGGLDRVARGRVAIREEHDPRDVERRDRRRRHLQRRGQVGPLPIEARRREARRVPVGAAFFDRRRFLIAFTASAPSRTFPGSAANGSTAKRFDPACGAARARKSSMALFASSPTLSLRLTAKTTNRSRVGRTRLRPASARSSSTTIDRPEYERQRPLPSDEIHQRPVEVVDQDRQDGQARQPPGAGQLQLDRERPGDGAHQSIHLR